MGRRFRSARLVGRDRDLADLLDAVLRVDPDRPVILVSGEAGIGKTRLLGELVDRLAETPGDTADPKPLVVRGSCLRLTAGDLPFAPILEILDAFGHRAATPELEGLRGRLAGEGAEGVGSAQARTMRFIEIHNTLVEAAGDARLVIVIDDLHWADQSTLDLLLFLARRLRGSQLVLIAAYRSDELHRRHPLRPVAAELSRGFVREAIDLAPLDGDAVAEQIAELGALTNPDVAQAILDRAQGNPFYVEELVALEPGRSTLPASVRDVLLARLAILDLVTVRVLGACAVVGRDVDESLVGELLEFDGPSITEALSTAVDHSILVPALDGRS
ncbi:MAG: AAA family ATPase, partial [Actinomycetota bacterium]